MVLDALLINPDPREYERMPYGDGDFVPVGLLYLAGALRTAGHSVVVLDFPSNGNAAAELESILADSPPAVAGFTTYTNSGLLHAVELTRQIKKRCSAFTVWGGPHALLMPHVSMRDVPELDSCAIGEGEEVMVHIVQLLKEGKPVNGIPGVMTRSNEGQVMHESRLNMAHISRPAWDLYPFAAGGMFPLVTSRGCPFKCAFCYNTARHSPYQPMPIDAVEEEIKYVVGTYHPRKIVFCDDNFCVQKKRALEIGEILCRHNLAFEVDIRADAVTREFVAELKRLGCEGFYIGIESGSDKVLERLNKMVTVEQSEEALRIFRELLIPSVTCAVMTGTPAETRGDLFKTWQFMRRVWYPGVEFSIKMFQLLPGTDIEQFCRERGDRMPETLEEWAQSGGQLHDYYGYADMTVGEVKLYTWLMRKSMGLRGFLKG